MPYYLHLELQEHYNHKKDESSKKSDEGHAVKYTIAADGEVTKISEFTLGEANYILLKSKNYKSIFISKSLMFLYRLFIFFIYLYP